MKKQLTICYLFLAASLLLIIYNEYIAAGGKRISEFFSRPSRHIEAKGEQIFSVSGQQFSFSMPADTTATVVWSGLLAQEGTGHASATNYRPLADSFTYTYIDNKISLLLPSLYTNNKAGLSWLVNDDLSISISGTCTETGALNIMTLYLEKGTYTLQGAYGCGSVTIEVVDHNKVSLGRLSSDTRSMQIDIPQDGEYTVRYFHIASDTPINAVSYPMLTKGTTVYAPGEHVKTVSVKLPEYFGGGSISSDGTITVTHYRAMLSKKSALSAPSIENGGTYRYVLQDYTSSRLCPAQGAWNIIYDVRSQALHPVAYCSLYDTNWAYTIAVADNNKHLIVRLPFDSSRSARTWFEKMKDDGKPVEIIYKLETPFTRTNEETFSADFPEGEYTILVPQGTLSITGHKTNAAP